MSIEINKVRRMGFKLELQRFESQTDYINKFIVESFFEKY